MNDVKKKVVEPKDEKSESTLRYRVRGMVYEADSPDAAYAAAKKENPEMFSEAKDDGDGEQKDEE